MKITDLSIICKWENLEKSAVYQIFICPTVCAFKKSLLITSSAVFDKGLLMKIVILKQPLYISAIEIHFSKRWKDNENSNN